MLLTKFSANEIQGMKNVCFPEPNLADPNEPKEISVIQACRNYSTWSSNPPTESLCSCNGSCIKRCCRCRKNGLKCSQNVTVIQPVVKINVNNKMLIKFISKCHVHRYLYQSDFAVLFNEMFSYHCLSMDILIHVM